MAWLSRLSWLRQRIAGIPPPHPASSKNVLFICSESRPRENADTKMAVRILFPSPECCTHGQLQNFSTILALFGSRRRPSFWQSSYETHSGLIKKKILAIFVRTRFHAARVESEMLVLGRTGQLNPHNRTCATRS